MIAGQPLARTYKPPKGIEEYTFYDCLDYNTVRAINLSRDSSKDVLTVSFRIPKRVGLRFCMVEMN